MSKLINQIKKAYLKALKAYAKGKINKGLKWEKKMLELELKQKRMELGVE